MTDTTMSFSSVAPSQALATYSPQTSLVPGLLTVGGAQYKCVNLAIEHANSIADPGERFDFQLSMLHSLTTGSEICLTALSLVYDYVQKDEAYKNGRGDPDLHTYLPDTTMTLVHEGDNIRNRAGEGFKTLRNMLEGKSRRADYMVEYLVLKDSAVLCNPTGCKPLKDLLTCCVESTITPETTAYKTAVVLLNRAIFEHHEDFKNRPSKRSNQPTRSSINYIRAKDIKKALDLWDNVVVRNEKELLRWRPTLADLDHMRMRYHKSGLLQPAETGSHVDSSVFPLFDDEVDTDKPDLIDPQFVVVIESTLHSAPESRGSRDSSPLSPPSRSPVIPQTGLLEEEESPLARKQKSLTSKDHGIELDEDEDEDEEKEEEDGPSSSMPRQKKRKRTSRDTAFRAPPGTVLSKAKRRRIEDERNRIEMEQACSCDRTQSVETKDFKKQMITLGTVDGAKEQPWPALINLWRLVSANTADLCQLHLRRLAVLMEVSVFQIDHAEVSGRVDRIANLCKHDTTLLRAWASTKTHHFFAEAPHIRKAYQKHNLGSLRSAPTLMPRQPRPVGDSLRNDSQTQSPDEFILFPRYALAGFDKSDYLACNSTCRGFLEDEQLGPIFQQELAMARFHLRLPDDCQSMMVHHMQNSLLAQVFRLYPVYWEANYRLRDDNNYRLLAYPVAPTYFPPGEDTAVMIYEGHTSLLKSGPCRIVKDYTMVTETATMPPETSISKPSPKKSPKKLRQDLARGQPRQGGGKFGKRDKTPEASVDPEPQVFLETRPEHLDKPGFTIIPGAVARIPTGLDGSTIDKGRVVWTHEDIEGGTKEFMDRLGHENRAVRVKWRPGLAIWEKTGVTNLVRWGPTNQHRWTFSTGMTAEHMDQEGFLENGVSWAKISKCHARLRYPDVDQFGDHVLGRGPVFPAVSLIASGLSYPISQALAGEVSWDSAIVQKTKNKWLYGSKQVIDEEQGRWFDLMKDAVLTAWVELQRIEQEAFPGNASYFFSFREGTADHPIEIDEDGVFGLPPNEPEAPQQEGEASQAGQEVSQLGPRTQDLQYVDLIPET